MYNVARRLTKNIVDQPNTETVCGQSSNVLDMKCCGLSLLVAMAASTMVLHVIAQSELPNATYSGYLPTNKQDGSELFYAYYEAQQDTDLKTPVPVILWLQVCQKRIRVHALRFFPPFTLILE